VIYYKRTEPTTFTSLPKPISDNGLAYKRTWVFHGNYDHTFSESVLNTLEFRYHDDKYYGAALMALCQPNWPQIPGVASHQYPPVMTFSGRLLSVWLRARGRRVCNLARARRSSSNDMADPGQGASHAFLRWGI